MKGTHLSCVRTPTSSHPWPSPGPGVAYTVVQSTLKNAALGKRIVQSLVAGLKLFGQGIPWFQEHSVGGESGFNGSTKQV